MYFIIKTSRWRVRIFGNGGKVPHTFQIGRLPYILSLCFQNSTTFDDQKGKAAMWNRQVKPAGRLYAYHWPKWKILAKIIVHNLGSKKLRKKRVSLACTVPCEYNTSVILTRLHEMVPKCPSYEILRAFRSAFDGTLSLAQRRPRPKRFPLVSAPPHYKFEKLIFPPLVLTFCL